MRVDAISTNLQTAKVMPLKNSYVSKVSNSETLKTDVFQKQNDVSFGDVTGATIGATVGAILATVLCPAAGPILLAYYSGAAAGAYIGNEIEENI